MHVAEIVPSADKQTSRASAKTHCAGYRNAMAMAISVALNAPIDPPHYGVFRM
jgi:hypothetical protein